MIEWSKNAEDQLHKHYELMILRGFPDPDSVIDRIFEAIEHLVYNPKMGKELENGLFKLTIKNPQYVVFYTAKGGITITGIYHHRQNRSLL